VIHDSRRILEYLDHLEHGRRETAGAR
jgi:hypothetical protein